MAVQQVCAGGSGRGSCSQGLEGVSFHAHALFLRQADLDVHLDALLLLRAFTASLRAIAVPHPARESRLLCVLLRLTC